ncbi:MAG: hypothetical protein WC061_02410 [Melioribacteraceae bacterium]
MKKAITLLMVMVLSLAIFNTDSKNISFNQSSDIIAQSVKAPVDAGKELLEGLAKLTSNKNLKRGLHTIYTSKSGAKYCVVLKDGKVDKLIVTSADGVQIKPKYIGGTGKDKPCIVCATLSKKPLVEECWEWQCDKKN